MTAAGHDDGRRHGDDGDGAGRREGTHRRATGRDAEEEGAQDVVVGGPVLVEPVVAVARGHESVAVDGDDAVHDDRVEGGAPTGAPVAHGKESAGRRTAMSPVWDRGSMLVPCMGRRSPRHRVRPARRATRPPAIRTRDVRMGVPVLCVAHGRPVVVPPVQRRLHRCLDALLSAGDLTPSTRVPEDTGVAPPDGVSPLDTVWPGPACPGWMTRDLT